MSTDRVNIVFTLTGTDRVGIVEFVTRLLLDLDGNVETSRMARLGGEFAMLALVSLPAGQLAALEHDVQALVAQGFKVTTTRTEQTYADRFAGWLPYQIEVRGADHEGIVHEVAAYLAQRGINIETMDTGVTQAPVSGSPLFSMTALVAVPPALAGQPWETDLADVGERLNVDVRVTAAGK
jgi:glycine cleavage system transcriptional repressor